MSRARATGPSADRELRARLGLDERASSDDILSTHEDVLAFLASAPRSLRSWARVQAAIADETFSLLTDPTVSVASPALEGSAARSAPLPGGPATPPARRAIPEAPEPPAVPVEEPSGEDVFDRLLADVTPSMHPESLPEPVGAGGTRAPAPAAAVGATSHVKARVPRLVRPAAVVIGAIVILFGGYQLGAGPGQAGSSAPTASSPAGEGLDEARVVALMERIQADPTDEDALMALADEYYRIGDFGASATWLEKLVALDESNLRARLALGAALFNLGDLDGAREHWEAVLDRDPANVEAHYDMGFLFLNLDPPDLDGVQRSWGEVVRLAPDSDIAATVKAHLDALASPDPSRSPAPTAPGSTAPSASPATGSPDPSGVPQP